MFRFSFLILIAVCVVLSGCSGYWSPESHRDESLVPIDVYSLSEEQLEAELNRIYIRSKELTHNVPRERDFRELTALGNQLFILLDAKGSLNPFIAE